MNRERSAELLADLPGELPAGLLTRIVAVACSDRELPRMAQELAGLVVRSAQDLTFCDVYVLDEDERAMAAGGEPVPLGEGDVGRVAASGRLRVHADGRGAAVPVRRDSATIAVLDVRSAGSCSDADLMLVQSLATLFAPVLCSGRRLRTAQHRELSAERFAERAVEVQEAERARLVRDIHDGIAQRLASLGFHLSACTAAELPAGVREQLAAARRQCELAAAETRAAIGALRPPVLDDLGLSAALATLAREAADRRHAPEVTVAVTGERDDTLPDHVQTALYRIAQEAVGNSVTHAAASHVTILLEHRRDQVLLTVRDDGAGFAAADVLTAGRRPDSYGLRGMAERAELLGGRLRIVSRPGAGTSITAAIPLGGPVTAAG